MGGHFLQLLRFLRTWGLDKPASISFPHLPFGSPVLHSAMETMVSRATASLITKIGQHAGRVMSQAEKEG